MTKQSISDLAEKEQKQTIAELTPDSKGVSLVFKVRSIEESRVVHSKKMSRPFLVANAIVGDATAFITMTLWNEEIDQIDVGKVYALENGYVRLYEECMYLNVGRLGSIQRIDEEIDITSSTTNMSQLFMGQKPRRSRERSRTGRSLTGKPGRESRGYCGPKGF